MSDEEPTGWLPPPQKRSSVEAKARRDERLRWAEEAERRAARARIKASEEEEVLSVEWAKLCAVADDLESFAKLMREEGP